MVVSAPHQNLPRLRAQAARAARASCWRTCSSRRWSGGRGPRRSRAALPAAAAPAAPAAPSRRPRLRGSATCPRSWRRAARSTRRGWRWELGSPRPSPVPGTAGLLPSCPCLAAQALAAAGSCWLAAAAQRCRAMHAGAGAARVGAHQAGPVLHSSLWALHPGRCAGLCGGVLGESCESFCGTNEPGCRQEGEPLGGTAARLRRLPPLPNPLAARRPRCARPASAQVFGDSFIHAGSPASGPPSYIDPELLLAEPTADRMVPFNEYPEGYGGRY